ncbi:hypothetical protein M409DRAFT_24892 [Zasmidium cellare ATCC 36951]|uniref:hydroxymethylglutaryl-CoA lyase n=1 Tax=Zasmidium cellare ATCC 36951 TaxID=1080233 RepID=A0A6A6CD70_ZASCE|nr:uncharacterized protein M409DRAFT_24892 [Zasmidium cellare ATCC 36951]KAF2164991.1 hypothetical protein M409DRAFT_24892 [Zasmidium cellare ATCC 36951]
MEVGPRDGLQNIKQKVYTSVKIELIRRLADTGLRHIEATSFVSPKWIPQLADSKEVMKEAIAIAEPKGISLPVLAPNVKGLERAAENNAKEVVVFASASEGFSWKNTNCSVEDALKRAEDIVAQAKLQGVQARGVISCVVACPYDGPTDPAKVLEVARRFLEMGCYEVGLGETIGVGTTYDIERLLKVLLTEIPAEKLAGHYHDTYGQAIANVAKSFDMGIRAFDSSVAGLGGCPYAKGAKGNLASEDMVYFFDRAGVKTGVDLNVLAETGDWISQVLAIPNNSRAGSAIAAKSKSASETNVKTPKAGDDITNWDLISDKGDYLVHRFGSAVRITLSRPKNGNALTTAMVDGITSLFKDLARDQSVFHILLEAEGKFFCTGMDLSSGGTTASTDPEEKAAYYKKVEDLYAAIDNAPQATIAVVNGPCYGGGVGLAFICDIRLMSSKAKFTMTEIKLGLSPAIISRYMVREWGIPFAREAMLTGREVKPDELRRIGAIHGLAENESDLSTMTAACLDNLSKCAPRSAAVCKQLVRLGWTDPTGPEQQDFVMETFKKMMQPGSEGEFGTDQFRKKIKNIDWAKFWSGKGDQVPQ